jgi:CubicO group peptidase (beta-lactamase class C family)
MNYKGKYLKYKEKYLELKNNEEQYEQYEQYGGKNNNIIYQASGIVIDDGEIKRKNHKSSSDTMYQIASCSKFITSLVVAKLYELKKLDYDTDINKYLTKWKCPNKGITLRYLLTHTSGSSDNNGFLGMEPQVPYTQNLQLNIDIIEGKSYSKPFNITEKPNKKFMYSGAGYQVIQQVLEEITGKRLYQLMEKYIFKPLNMKNSTGKLLYEGKHKYKLADMDGLYRMYPETAAAGVWMSCNDLLLLVLDIMDGYNNPSNGNNMSNGSKILKQDTIKMITKGEHPEWQKKYANYGLGMFVSENGGHKLFAHDGSNFGYKMHFHCIPDKNFIEIIMVNHNPKYHKGLRNEAKKMLQL